MSLANVSGFQNILYAFQEASKEIILSIPKLVVAALVLALAVAIAKLGNKLVRTIVRLSGVDKIVERYLPDFPVSIEAIAVILFDLGVIIVALAAVIAYLAPSYMEAFTTGLTYTLKLASVGALILLVFALVESLAKRLRTEAKIRAFATLVTYLLILLLVLDIVSLSPEVKQAIGQGIALGLGLAIGAFSAWYFFHDYLDVVAARASERSQCSSRDQPQSPSS